MDGQELYNLHEAYMEVVENQQLNEELTGARAKKAEKKGFKQLARGQEGSRAAKNIRGANLPTRRGGGGEKGEPKVGMRSSTASDQGSGNESKRRQGKKVADTRGEEDFDYQYSKQYDEQVDIYDIILSHLLDEGYAETLEAAEVMMVNMSEEWRESILSEGEEPLPYGRMMKKSNELADSDDKKKQKRAANIYLAANSPKGPKVKIRK